MTPLAGGDPAEGLVWTMGPRKEMTWPRIER
jgi:hypothetical protein